MLDINDNLPQFDRDEYEYRLDEDRALGGTRLIRVHASDRDDGENGLVKYALVEQSVVAAGGNVNVQQSQQQPQETNFFQIDELSGWISVSADKPGLDYEQASIYRLVVRAQDSGLVNSMPVYTNVLVYLNDVNDNPPQINITLPGSDSLIDDEPEAVNLNITPTNLTLSASNPKLELSEYTAPNSFIAQVIVSDADSGANGQIDLEMRQFKRSGGGQHKWAESNDFELVHLFNNIYSLMTKTQLDRERFDEYKIELRAQDAGQPRSLQTLLELRVVVQDENDNRPMFVNLTSAAGYEFNVAELGMKLDLRH